jgi:A-factor biosynthesis hotdog protein
MSGIRAAQPTAEPPTSWEALLSVDRRHPFFFDHPLDHVPGIQLAVGLLDLVRGAAGAATTHAPGVRLRLSLDFVRFCELDGDVRLRVTAARDGFHLRAEQDGQAVCEGRAELDVDPVPVPVTAVTAPEARPAPAHLVHRRRPENLAVGELHQPRPPSAESRVLAPPPGHYLLQRDPTRYSAEELLEAGRQLSIMLGHVAHGRPLDSQMLWLAVALDLPCGLPRSLPLVLRWAGSAPDGDRSRFDLTLGVPGNPGCLGALSYSSRTLSPQAYQRKRFAAARAGNAA